MMSQAPVTERTSRRRDTAAPAGKAAKKAAKAAPRATVPSWSGASPRVDLLPPIVEVRRKQSATVRLLLLGLVGVALVAVAASLAVSLLAGAAENTLAQERQRSVDLLAEQATYTELMNVSAQLLDYDSAQMAALYAEADWPRLMRELDAALPADVSLTSETIAVRGLGTGTTASPADTTAAIDAPGVIEISFTATSPTFASPTPLLNGLQTLTGHVSSDVSAVASSGADGYTITGTVRLDGAALGGTARTGALDADTLQQLHDALVIAATVPAAPAPATDATTDATTGAGE